MSPIDSSRFAIGTQAYYPGQAYNTPAMLQLAASIDLFSGRLLDIGCGDGQLLRLLSERFPQIELAGLTVSEDERRVCGEKFDVRVGDMHVLPWKDEFFDAVIGRHSLEHSISPLTALFEVNRVLRLDGVFHVVVPAPVSEWVVKWKDHFSVLSKPMWEKLFDDAGFVLDRFEEGEWLASFSMQPEVEMRFVLRKVRDVKSEHFSSPSGEMADRPVLTAPSGSDVLNTLVERKIVVVVHNLVLFDAVRPVVARFMRDVKFLVPLTGDAAFDAMGERTLEGIAAAGFEVERVALPADIRCEIELSPYPYAAQNVCHATWRVRFMYGLAKEAWNFSLANNVYYDFVLTYGDYDSRVISAYSTPVRVGNSKISPVTRAPRENNALPVLLYLPTYSPTSSIEAVSRIRDELKAKYRVIAKAHHGTTYLEPARISLLQEWVDELAHHDTSLSSLLEKADVVLSDGSGAIFDAVAAGVPIAVFQDKVFAGLGGTVSLEERIVQDALIPATDSVEGIPAVLERAIEAGSGALDALRTKLFAALGDEAADRAATFVSDLLANIHDFDTFAAARRMLLTRLQEGEAQRVARGVAERQLNEAYRNLTDRLLADVHAALGKVAERDRHVSELESLLQATQGKAAERDRQVSDLESLVQAAQERVAERDRQVSDLESLVQAAQERVAERDRQMSELEHLRSEAADRDYWEARARALENSTSWRVTSSGRAIKSAAVLALQPGQIGKRAKHLRELARTRGLAAAGAWLWQRLSEGREQRTPASEVCSTSSVAISEPADIRQGGAFDELKTYMRERSYTGIFVMGSRHMGWHEVFKQRSHHIAEYMMERGYLVLCAMNPVYPQDYTPCIKRDREQLFIVNFDDRSIWRDIIELLATNSTAPLCYYMVGTEPGTTFEELGRLKQLGYLIYYDFIDEISKDIHPGISDFCLHRHDALLRDEDVLLVTSADNLYQKAAKHRQKNLICAPNGVRLEDWIVESDVSIPSEMADIVADHKPIIGYYGNFAVWMNYDYIKALSRSRPDVNIVMIGHDYDLGRGAFTNSRIAELPNVHVLPAQKYRDLKYFSRFFDVGIIPFRDYELTKSVSPVKMFEYMAQGIPIVVSGLEECRKYSSCLTADSAEDFVVKVGHALTLKNDAAYMAQLRKEAEANTWAARGDMIETAITAATANEPGKLLTITIPTYNMETLLPRCLDSMLPPSQLQRLEIIIVNDGSKDGSLRVARNYEARFPEVVRVIDKENGGHGSTLNSGIREAKGKYFKIVDADDWLHPTELVAHMVFLAGHDADMVVTNYMRTYDDGRRDLILYSDRLQQKEYARDDFYRALMIDLSNMSYAHMHAITYKTKILQDNNVSITEKSFYVDQEYISFPQEFVANVCYQDIFLYRYYIGRPGQSVSPDVARKRAPENYRILKNIIAYCDSLPRDSKIRAYITNIAYHQTWFYFSWSDDDEAKMDIILWWKENNSRFFRRLNEQFRVLAWEAAQ